MSPRSSEEGNARPSSTLTIDAVEGESKANPFPGPRPFSESENRLFFGRERELSDLVALLFAQRAVLVHGPSGGGKSSLVSAGLIPRARERGFEFLPVARVRDAGARMGDEVAGNRYVHNVIENWRVAGLEVGPDCTTLAAALGGLPPVDEPGRVVILRDRLATRYHVRGLRSDQALEAVVRPFAVTGRTFAPGVAEQLVKALREQPAESAAVHSYEGEDVEPVQLQIVCQALFDRLPPDLTEIRAEHVQRHADVQRALVGFYENALVSAIKRHPRIHERRVRLWFERQLITPARTRGIVFRGERETAGLPNEIVDELERRRVVRSEPRGPATWYELPHDRLVDAVLGSNRVWYAARSRTMTRTSAVVGGIGLLAAVLAFFLFVRGTGGSGGSSAAAPQKARISVPGQTVDFAVSGKAGQLLTAVMIPDEGFDGQLRLLDAQGAVVGQPSAGDSPRPVLTLALPTDGDYRVQGLGRGSSTGSFLMSLSVQDVDARTEIVPLRPTPGALTGKNEVDVFTFAGRAGATAQITMTSENSLHHRLVMIGPAGQTFVSTVDQLSFGLLVVVLPQDGTYELRASSAQGVSGSYRMDLQFPEEVAKPGTVTGTIDNRSRVDVRTLRSDTGGALELSMRSPSAGFVGLLSGDGRLLTYTDVSANEDKGFSAVIAPSTPYTVVAVTSSSDPAPFSLSLAMQDALPLARGTAHGELRPRQVAIYRLDGQPGSVVTILVTPSASLDARVLIVQPDGTTLIGQDGGGQGSDELFTVQLRKTGPHLLVISAANPDSLGTFRVAVTQGRAATTPS